MPNQNYDHNVIEKLGRHKNTIFPMDFGIFASLSKLWFLYCFYVFLYVFMFSGHQLHFVLVKIQRGLGLLLVLAGLLVALDHVVVQAALQLPGFRGKKQE